MHEIQDVCFVGSSDRGKHAGLYNQSLIYPASIGPKYQAKISIMRLLLLRHMTNSHRIRRIESCRDDRGQWNAAYPSIQSGNSLFLGESSDVPSTPSRTLAGFGTLVPDFPNAGRNQ